MKRRDFLLGASAIVAGAVLPANAVRGRDLEWIGIDYAAGPDAGGYLIPPDIREEFDRAVAKAFAVPAPILRGATYAQFDDTIAEFLSISMRAFDQQAEARRPFDLLHGPGVGRPTGVLFDEYKEIEVAARAAELVDRGPA